MGHHKTINSRGGKYHQFEANAQLRTVDVGVAANDGTVGAITEDS